MELRYFFSVLSKRKWILLLTMLVAAVTTFVVVSKLPKKYKSSTVISTGITTQNRIRVDETSAFVQEFEVENKFANMIEFMKSRPAINILIRKLMQNDLSVDTGQVFRKLDLEKSRVSKEDFDNYVKTLEKPLDSISVATNSLSDLELQNERTARALESALGYDYETIYKLIDIKRVTKSDYVSIEYTSENPKLSYFIVKNYTDAVLNYFHSKKEGFNDKKVAYYNETLKAKKDSLEKLNNDIYNYSKANGVVALLDQSQSIVAQIKEAEMELTEERKKLANYAQAESEYKSNQNHYAEFIRLEYDKNVFSNEEVRNLTTEINSLLAKSVETGGKDESIKNRIELLKEKRANVSKRLALNNRREDNPEMAKNNELYMRFVEARGNRKGAEDKILILENAINKLKSEKAKLVNDNAELKKLTQQYDVAEQEYKDAVEKQSQASAIKETSSDEEAMNIIVPALPPLQAENNKAPLLAAFAGLGTGTMATVLIFLLTYLDRSLSTPFQFNKLVGLPLLGSLNKLNDRKVINFDYLFAEGKGIKENEAFKESLRKIRHDIEASGDKSFLFVSLKDQEGKSFLAASLAYTFSMKNKKVLIIDTNFKNNTLTGLSISPMTDLTGEEAAMTAKATKLSIDISLPNVRIVGNKGGFNSPSELLAGVDFKKKIKDLGKNYDYIFLEAASLNQYSDARELVDFVEKVIPVFDATTSVNQVDENGIEFLKSLNGKLLGSVLNKMDIKSVA